MDRPPFESHERVLRIGTRRGVVDGTLRIRDDMRTLDFLNSFATRFLSLEAPSSLSTPWVFEAPSTVLNIDSVLWVTEMECAPRTGRRPQMLHRVGVRLALGRGEVRGFIHATLGSNPLSNLNNRQAPFIAVTAASIVEPEFEFATRFLAVNSRHLFAAELIVDEQPFEESGAVESHA